MTATPPVDAVDVTAEADASALDSNVQSAANASASLDVTTTFAMTMGAMSGTANVAIATPLFGIGRRIRHED